MTVLPLHVVAGTLAVVAGFLALAARKGGPLHRRSGAVSAAAMMAVGVSGAILAAADRNSGNLMGGALAVYLVATGLLTLRRGPRPRLGDAAALLGGLGIATLGLVYAVQAWTSPAGTKDGYPPILYGLFGAVALLAAIGDVRLMVARGVHGRARTARHLWRMCLGMFMGTGSLFFGQPQVFPEFLRGGPVLAVFGLAPLGFMLVGLARTWRGGPPRRDGAAPAGPTRSRPT